MGEATLVNNGSDYIFGDVGQSSTTTGFFTEGGYWVVYPVAGRKLPHGNMGDRNRRVNDNGQWNALHYRVL